MVTWGGVPELPETGRAMLVNTHEPANARLAIDWRMSFMASSLPSAVRSVRFGRYRELTQCNVPVLTGDRENCRVRLCFDNSAGLVTVLCRRTHSDVISVLIGAHEATLYGFVDYAPDP